MQPCHEFLMAGAAGCFTLRFISMKKFSNTAAYKFTALPDIRGLRARLLALCKSWDLKGTILLSVEGINLFVAGEQDRIDLLLRELRQVPGLADLPVKSSETDHQPFRKMLVRIKKEIIAFGVEGINPAQRTSPKLAAKELKQWLDEGRPVTLLDTRNDYEVKLGTFKNALSIGIDHFRDFPDAVRRLGGDLQQWRHQLFSEWRCAWRLGHQPLRQRISQRVVGHRRALRGQRCGPG